MNKFDHRKSKFLEFLTGRGFYIALALSLIGAGTAAWIAVDRTLDGIAAEPEPSVSQSQAESSASTIHLPEEEASEPWQAPASEETDANQAEIEKPSTGVSDSSSASSSSASSSPASIEQPAVSKESEPPASSPQQFAMTLSGQILNPYSGGNMVKSVTLNEWRTHDGIDIAAGIGSAVKAVAAGTVTDITTDEMWGTTITIDHGGALESVYSSLGEQVHVAVGDTVELGQTIGAVAETAQIEIGLSPHLHFAMRLGGEWVDPLSTMQMEAE